MTMHPQEPFHPSLPIEEIARYPLPGMSIPDRIAFTPDDRLVSYLWSPEGSLYRSLYAYDLESGRQRLLVEPPGAGATDNNVSLEEALRRERMRQREHGITAYAWSKQGMRLLIPQPDGLYVQQGVEGRLRKILDTSERPALDAQFSPDGEWVAYVQEDEVYVIPSSGGEPHQVTSGARGSGKTNGLAEFIAQEEMDRFHGFWWAPDSQRIAFEEVDESHIPQYRIMHQGKDLTGQGAQEDHRYPFAGQPNAKVRLGVTAINAGGETIWMDLGDDSDQYLARVDWLPDGRLAAQVQNREQSRLDLVVFDANTGAGSKLLTETSQVWINLHDLFHPMLDQFLWASERSGFRHLYLYDYQGNLVRQLTQGDWMVDDVCGVDAHNQVVYFTATLPSPLESQLYCISFQGGEPLRITPESGMHSALSSSGAKLRGPVCDHACRHFVDTHHSIKQPPVVRLRSLQDGAVLGTIYEAEDPRIQELDLRPPELVRLENRSGETLFGAVYRPSQDQFGDGPFPTIVNVYGGPHAQLVTNGWGMTASMRPQYLRSLGFLVFVLDNRGSARRGLQFESWIRHRMGHHEVEDQVDGVHWLAAQGLADPKRVGINGWSYGGYMSLMCLARAPETFRVAVAGAPVTAMDGYDTHYTERYLGTPQSNPEGYRLSSVLTYADQLQGKLMLVHGLIDENVHFRHTARLINALVQARKPYDLLLFPDERHMPRRPADRIYMEELIRDYFIEHLR